MILYGRIGQSDVRPHLQPPYKRSLLTIENFARLNEWIEQGEVDIQVWLAIRGTIKADNPSDPRAAKAANKKNPSPNNATISSNYWPKTDVGTRRTPADRSLPTPSTRR